MAIGAPPPPQWTKGRAGSKVPVMAYDLRRCLALLLGAAILFVASGVQAARVAVLLPDVQPAVTAELAQRFHDAVTQGFAASAADVVPAAETRLRLSSVQEIERCTSGSCTSQAAALLGATRIVTIHLSALGKDYSLRLTLLEGGQEIARVDETCDVCTVREVIESLHRAGAKLATDPRAQASAVQPTRQPTRQKLPEPVPPAERPPVVSSAADGAPGVAPAALTPRGEPAKIFPWRWLGVGSLVLGVVGLAVGIPLLVIDGRPTCDLPDPIHSCPQLYNTLGGGAALVAIGGAAIVAGSVFLVLDHRARAQVQVSFQPFLGGGGLRALVGF